MAREYVLGDRMFQSNTVRATHRINISSPASPPAWLRIQAEAGDATRVPAHLRPS